MLGTRCRRRPGIAAGAAVVLSGTAAFGAAVLFGGTVLLGGVTSAASAAVSSPKPVPPSKPVSLPKASVTSVTFSGAGGPGVASPTITLTGFNFGASAPAGTSDSKTSCGTFAGNGDVYGSQLHFVADDNFEAGYNGAIGANCIGIIVVSWSADRAVLRFGAAYGKADQWYLAKGDGYAVSLNDGIYGGTVSGLKVTSPS